MTKPVIPVKADGCVIKCQGWLIEVSDDGHSLTVKKTHSLGEVVVREMFNETTFQNHIFHEKRNNNNPKKLR